MLLQATRTAKTGRITMCSAVLEVGVYLFRQNRATVMMRMMNGKTKSSIVLFVCRNTTRQKKQPNMPIKAESIKALTKSLSYEM